MNKRNNLFFIIIAAIYLSVLLAACEGPAGPQGPSGTATTFEGFAPDIVCGDCHNPDQDSVNYVWAKRYQWMLSKHYLGGDYERNTSTCAGCHTTEGFIQATAGIEVTTHTDASPPGCFACHSPHSRGNFSLRTTAPPTLNETVAGQGQQIFDYGKGNLCASCHKPRTIDPKPDPTKVNTTDTIVITSSRWYPHYGVQSQMLKGTGGFQFIGYTYTGNSNHTDNPVIKQEGCIMCHMADATAGSGIAGGHTMNISYENTSHQPASLTTGCMTSGCHSQGFTIDYIGSSAFLTGGLGAHSATIAMLDTLMGLLVEKGWYDSTTGQVIASSGNPLRIAPAARSGALFNFFFVEHDLSKGAHNSRYTLELLRSSIDELRKP